MTRSLLNECEAEENARNNDSGRLVLDSMTRNDRLLIKTNNSIYKFVCGDPALRQGVLTGGTLDDASRRAILIGSISEDADGRKLEIPGLKVGARAVFYLFSPAGMERLITSVVITLTLSRGDKNLPLHTDSFDRMFVSQSLLMPA
jgi:hypothetical protein